MYKFHKRTTSEGVKDEMIINEDALMEVDSIEWTKEVKRVSTELDDFARKLEEGDALLLLQSKY